MKIKDVEIPINDIVLNGILAQPPDVHGTVIFVHGSGSSRKSPRNLFVADFLNNSNFATVLFDLLTETEDEVYMNRFDIELLTKRLLEVTKWVSSQESLNTQLIGYFGASTGAAAALIAGAALGKNVSAIVSRGGRVDLAGDSLSQVVSPTLFIIGGDDLDVLKLNEEAYKKLPCTKSIKVIPGATHLFEEPGALEEVAKLAKDWFERYSYER